MKTNDKPMTRKEQREHTRQWTLAERERKEQADAAKDARIKVLEDALVAFCDANLGNHQERAACRRQAYVALDLFDISLELSAKGGGK